MRICMCDKCKKIVDKVHIHYIRFNDWTYYPDRDLGIVEICNECEPKDRKEYIKLIKKVLYENSL